MMPRSWADQLPTPTMVVMPGGSAELLRQLVDCPLPADIGLVPELAERLPVPVPGQALSQVWDDLHDPRQEHLCARCLIGWAPAGRRV